ncbi:MAG: hypothetical protein AMXMBFR84_29890 [Candidatus Hydrogenedentota bacterium]
MTDHKDPASFRDPSGFVYRDVSGKIFRQINRPYENEYQAIQASGLWDKLIADGLLVPHRPVPLDLRATDDAVAVLEPQPIPFISYPYEWCFGQLRSAALLTLEIQLRALEKGFVLKDASAFNVQFNGCKPVFIDTLSFEQYRENEPWVAYGQFCRHFLAPLALMRYRNTSLNRLLSIHIDGVLLECVSPLLPWQSWLRSGIAVHVHMLGKAEQAYKKKREVTEPVSGRLKKGNLIALVDSLKSTVRGLQYKQMQGLWTNYDSNESYSEAGVCAKRSWVRATLDKVKPAVTWDLGANTGEYSRMAAAAGSYVIGMDGDSSCIQHMWEANHDRVLPLAMDLSNPTPSLGWAHTERASLLERGPADCALALALLHHLAIGNNVPLDRLAVFFARCARCLLVEWVPKEDPQCQRLLVSRRDIFTNYTREAFEHFFTSQFDIDDMLELPQSGRVLYRMQSKIVGLAQ